MRVSLHWRVQTVWKYDGINLNDNSGNRSRMSRSAIQRDRGNGPSMKGRGKDFGQYGGCDLEASVADLFFRSAVLCPHPRSAVPFTFASAQHRA